ncbi:MAG: hypothetical protein ABJE95_22595 [Byssovorax sp.]
MAKAGTKKATQGKGSLLKSLALAVEKARAAVRAAEAALEAYELAAYTSEERAHSAGKLRDGEEVVLEGILDTVDAHPEQFASLAPHDHGTDDRKVETGPAREALARRSLLVPLAQELVALTQRVSDDVLSSGAFARDVTTPAYAIIKANEPINPALRKSASVPLNFYAKQAQKKGSKKSK